MTSRVASLPVPSPLRGVGEGEGSVSLRRRRELRHHQTDTEKKLWRLLRGRRLAAYKFRRQHPVGPFIVDFCCPTLRLVLELDGGQHATDIIQDAQRTRYLKTEGYRVIRFWNTDVLLETPAVLQLILNSIDEQTQEDPHPDPLPGRERELQENLA